MQKYILILLTIIFSLTIIQCSSETENREETEKLDAAVNEFDSTDLKTTNIKEDVENNNFLLEYKFDEGKSVRYRLTILSHSERNMESDSVINSSFDQKTIRLFNIKTVSVENDSIAEMECNITNIKVDVDVDGEKVSYKSGDESMDSTKLNRFIEHEGLVNNPFRFRITKYGELLDVFKVDKLTDKFLELSSMKDSVKVEEKVTFKNQIVNNLLKPLISQIFRTLPTKQLEVETTWDKLMDPAPVLVFNLQYTNHYKVSDLEMLNNDRIAIIDGIATTTVEGESKHTNNGINYTFHQPVSEATAKIYFNLDKGMVQKSKTKTYLKIKYDMEMPSAKGLLKGNSTELMENKNILELL